MRRNLLLGWLITGLLCIPALADSVTMRVELTIPAALEVHLEDDALAWPIGSFESQYLTMTVGTNDWPLTLTLWLDSSAEIVEALRLEVCFVLGENVDGSEAAWTPILSTEQGLTFQLHLHGWQTYSLGLRTLGRLDNPPSIPLILAFESSSGIGETRKILFTAQDCAQEAP